MDTMELLTKFADPETLQTLSTMQRLMAGLVTTILGMGITFLALIVLQFVISLMEKLSTTKTETEQATAPHSVSATETVSNKQNDEELVAAITVALAVQLKTAASNIVIRNIKKIEDRTPVWNKVGLTEQMTNQL